jgi:SAM-dependent methyltransferase
VTASSIGTSTNECVLCSTKLDRPALDGIDRLYGVAGTFQIAICPNCGAGVTVPVVATDELGEFYPGHYEAYHGARSSAAATLFRAYHMWRDVLSRRQPPLSAILAQPPGTLLDVGSGKGEPSAMLVERGWSVVGVEPSPEASAIARTRGIDAREGVLETATLDDRAPFDAVLFHHSLEHVADPVADLRRAFKLLRAGGSVFVSAPNFGSWQRSYFGTYWYPLDLPRHRTHFTANSLSRALEVAGFDLVDVSTQSTLQSLPVSAQYAIFGRYRLQGQARRIAVGLYALVYPLTLAIDRLGGGGDILTVVARKP